MEKFQELREQAKKKIQLADHLLFVTYPLVQDPKLLLAIIENIFLSLSYSITSVLHYEHTFKRIPAFHESFENKYRIFIEHCMKRYKIDKESVRLIKELRNLLLQHKKSPVEFARKDSLIICSDNYRMKKIDPLMLKDYVSKAKVFIDKTSQITRENERIFR